MSEAPQENSSETTPARPALRPAIAALPAYVPGARPAPGAKVHRLASNENPFPPLPSVAEELAAELQGINRYPDMGTVDLLDALATHLTEEVGTPITPAHVATGTGSVAVLGHVLQAFVGPGDEVIYPWRSFEAYPIVVDVIGGSSVRVPLGLGASIDVDALAAAVTDRTRVLIACTPNNPTGTTLTHADLVRLVDAVPPHVVVLVDEAYLEFVRGEDPVRALDLVTTRPNVIALRTFSKAYGLAGLRVGYAVGSPELIAGVKNTATPFGVSSLAQRAAVLSLGARAELLARVDSLVDERSRVVAELREQGWTIPETQANFVWFELGEQSAAFAAAANEAGILVRPFAGDGVRISIGDAEDNDALLAFTRGWLAAAG